MYINLILSQTPTQHQLRQIFHQFGFRTCAFLQEYDWENLENDDNEIIVNFSKTIDKKWQCYLDIFIHTIIENEKLFYFKIAQQIAIMTLCDVICCYYDYEIINSPIQNNPFYDFAYINQHWYWIDDIDADYANARLEGGEIKIIKSIDKEMEYFLEFGNYLHHNH